MKYVVGDIHGEITKLTRLCDYIISDDQKPEFIFIGDYLDKGENVYETLVFLNDLQNRFDCTFLYGNHEFYWLNYVEEDTTIEKYLLKYGGLATITSMDAKSLIDCKERLLDQFSSFFGSLQSHWMNANYIAVHSGISPKDFQLPITAIPLKNLLFNRYDFFKHQDLYLGKYQIIFGHTGFFTPFIDNYKIGIDTAACFLEEQPLTAFCLDNLAFYNSENKCFFSKDLPKNQCPNIPRNQPWRNKC
ncbi:MAG: serine/threonine protein phosphatase [Saprospiraceae bacterium]|nr:MAG: serine/threonine protein phosphatase [Saprospiraceae bacterium]